MQQRKISFIGGGNMAQAIVSGMLTSGYSGKSITISDPQPEKVAYFTQQGVAATTLNSVAIASADVVVLAVKPQLMSQVAAELKSGELAGKLVISIAAGVSVQRLQSLFSTDHIVRVMPNTPALISQGMSGIYFPDNISQEDKAFALELMTSVGRVSEVSEESDINVVTAVSGSSPAYFFKFMEAMQACAIKMGLSSDDARLFVQQSALGAASMVIENPDVSLSTLREQVTSKGGTTAAALQCFETHQLSNIIEEAMQAALNRAEEMEKEL